MAWSSCATRYHDGMVFHAASGTEALKAAPMIGFGAAARPAAPAPGTPAAKSSWNFPASTYRKPAASGLSAARSWFGYFSPKAPIGSFAPRGEAGGEARGL